MPDSPTEPQSDEDTPRATHSLVHLWVNGSIIGTFLLLSFGVIYFAQSLLVPLLLAFMFALILSPIVRVMRRRARIPDGVTAALLVLGFSTVLVSGSYGLSGPITKWISDAPEISREVQNKLASLSGAIEKVKAAQKQVDEVTEQDNDPGVEEVVIKEPNLLTQAARGAPEIIAGFVLGLVLLLFLLASGDMFYEKLVRALPTLTDKKRGLRIAHDVEREISRYLLTVTLINLGLGVFIAGGMYLLGMPNPILWGLAAAALNFVPYLGSVAGIIMVAIVALVSFPTVEQAALAPAWYLICTAVEGQFVTPPLVGKRLRINSVAVFLAIAFWGWIWGVIGVFIAVPLLIIVKVFSRHIDGLGGLEEFLGDRNSGHSDPP